MVLPLILIAAFAGATIVTHIFVCIGIGRSRNKEAGFREADIRREFPSPQLPVTVVIPAKDEEKSLPRLMEGLDSQSFKDFSVIFINDRSQDDTPRILEAYKTAHPEKTTLLHLTENLGKYNPKQYALSKGIEVAKEGILLFTDADCALPPDWVKGMRAPFDDDSIGLVFGAVFPGEGRGFLRRFQIFDHAFRYYYTAGVAGLTMPSGGFGNNLAVRTRIIREIGGYDSIEDSATEDAALIAAVRERTTCGIAALTAPEITVKPAPLESLRALSRQELRWSFGAFFSKDPKAVLGYGAVMLFLAGGLFALPFIALFKPLWMISAATFLSMLSVALAGALCSRIPSKSYWFLIIPNILFASLLYTFVNIMCLLKVPINWKGKKL